jgi:dTDP-4-dehydrorhamnose reductase
VVALRWVVTGAGGLLGRDVVESLRGNGSADVIGLDRGALDVSDAAACARAVVGADVVVNCAAYTAVDAAETHPAAAFAVNAEGVAHLAAAAEAVGARFVHVSTDYVFDGPATTPYRVDDVAEPTSVYGRSKLAGERAVAALGSAALVLRTAWLYGRHGNCFPRTMVRLARERGELSVVDDQVGSPTWSVDVARVVRDLVLAAAPAGTYHATSAERTSWWGFARAVLESAGLGDVPVRAVSSAEFPTAARRPGFSVLDTASLARVGVEAPGNWWQRWAVASGAVLRGSTGSGVVPLQQAEQVVPVATLAEG